MSTWQSAEAEAYTALALLAAGTPDAALKAAEAALATDPQSSLAHWVHANVLSSLERHDDALIAYANCAADMVQEPMWHAGRITSLSKLGRHAEAIAAAEEGVRHAPEDGIIWYRKGAALARAARAKGGLTPDRKLMKRAKAALLHAIELDPTMYTARLDLGGIYLAENNYRGAKRMSQEALALKPGDPRMHGLAAEIALQNGDLDEAESHIDFIVSAWPGEREAIRFALRLKRARSSWLSRYGNRLFRIFFGSRPRTLLTGLLLGLLFIRLGVTRTQLVTGVCALGVAAIWLWYRREQALNQAVKKPLLSRDF